MICLLKSYIMNCDLLKNHMPVLWAFAVLFSGCGSLVFGPPPGGAEPDLRDLPGRRRPHLTQRGAQRALFDVVHRWMTERPWYHD